MTEPSRGQCENIFESGRRCTNAQTRTEPADDGSGAINVCDPCAEGMEPLRRGPT